MKCVGIQYLETIRKYITEKLKLKRTIHICFTPGKYNNYTVLKNKIFIFSKFR